MVQGLMGCGRGGTWAFLCHEVEVRGGGVVCPELRRTLIGL